MTGIKERRFWDADFKASQASFLAGDKVLKRVSSIGNLSIYLFIQQFVEIVSNLRLPPMCIVFWDYLTRFRFLMFLMPALVF